MTEFEKKRLLSKDEYDYLIERFGYDERKNKKPIFKQVNYYFDTDDFSMNKQDITCRVRLKGGKYKGTMKSHATGAEASKETNIEVRDGVHDNAFIDMGLKLQGELITDRSIVLKDTHYEVVLDKNEYLGTFDYELEIEYAPEHEQGALAIYKMFLDALAQRKGGFGYEEGYEEKQSSPSKSNRFFERYFLEERG